MSLNHGRSTAPPVCRICGAEITRLALPCQVKAASPLSLGFSLMHLWAGVAFSDNRKAPSGFRDHHQQGKTPREGFSTQLWLMSVRPLAHSRNSNNIWVFLVDIRAGFPNTSFCRIFRVQVSGEAQAFHELVVQLLLNKLRHYVGVICS